MNKLTTRSFSLLLIAFAACMFTSCDKEEDYNYIKPGNNNNTNTTNTTKISAPVFEKYLTTTTTMDLSLRCRFNNGGDKTDNMSCTAHWRQYESKPASTPKASDMNKHETMRVLRFYEQNDNF